MSTPSPAAREVAREIVGRAASLDMRKQASVGALVDAVATALAAKDAEIDALRAQVAGARREALKALRDEVFALCEDTEEKYASIASTDLEGKQGAYASGRIHEAKGIRRTIGEVARTMMPEPLARALADKEPSNG